MPRAEPDYVEFTADRVDAVVSRMTAMAAAHSGWVNFEPAVLMDDVPPPKSGLFSLFSGRGPDVPLATWTAGELHKGREGPPNVGILHPSGSGARSKLVERGCAVPEGWVVLQDSSKKGIVAAVPPSVGNAEVVRWLLRATTALSLVPLTGRWRAALYHP